jgi:hypothetical protein
MPKLVHTEVARTDVAEIMTLVKDMFGVGMNIDDLAAEIRRQAGLPQMTEEDINDLDKPEETLPQGSEGIEEEDDDFEDAA